MNDRISGRPRAIAAVVRRGDGRWLLVRRAPGRPAAGYWTPVTGRVEPGESLSRAAERELFEEVGLVGQARRRLEVGFTDDGRWELHAFEMSLADDGAAFRELTLATEELAEARWLTVAEIARLEPMFDGTRRFYEREAERS